MPQIRIPGTQPPPPFTPLARGGIPPGFNLSDLRGGYTLGSGGTGLPDPRSANYGFGSYMNGLPSVRQGFGFPTVDYASLVNSLLAPLQKEAAGFSAADRAALQAQQRRAVIAFGAPIDASGNDLSLVGGGNFNKSIDQNTLDLARKNTESGLSVLARLMEAHQDAQRGVTNNLADRGLLRSGETGYQMGREQTQNTRAQYDARQKVLDYLSGIQAAFTQAEQQRQWALAMEAMQAAQSVPFYPPYDYGYGAGGGAAGGYIPPERSGSSGSVHSLPGPYPSPGGTPY